MDAVSAWSMLMPDEPVLGAQMSDLERARAHLLYCQSQLARAREFRWVGEYTQNVERHFLAALSWVWEEQEKAEIARIAGLIEKYCVPIPAFDPTMIDWQAFFGMRK